MKDAQWTGTPAAGPAAGRTACVCLPRSSMWDSFSSLAYFLGRGGKLEKSAHGEINGSQGV
jgi:hypothetical protein